MNTQSKTVKTLKVKILAIDNFIKATYLLFKMSALKKCIKKEILFLKNRVLICNIKQTI